MKTESQPDSYLDQFLDFLTQDSTLRPEAVQPIDPILAQRSQALTDCIEIDLDKPLSAADE